MDKEALDKIKRWVRANTEYQQPEAYGRALPTVDSKKLLEYVESLVINQI